MPGIDDVDPGPDDTIGPDPGASQRIQRDPECGARLAVGIPRMEHAVGTDRRRARSEGPLAGDHQAAVPVPLLVGSRTTHPYDHDGHYGTSPGGPDG